MESAIEIRGLRKVYRTRHGRQPAVDNLTMDVPRGGVHGFLGPNGAGKTTTLRIITGLVRADSGTVRILGHLVPRKLPKVLNRIGVIVESPHFLDAFSARLNLELLAQSIGVKKRRVDEVLAQTQLLERADDRVKAYSLGMRQRLSVAAAMLKDPEIFIFDEPTNGLDPQGIREIRQTIKDLGASGRTVLVSSHILSEVEQFADTLTIIGRGRVMSEGSIAELRHERASVLDVGVADVARATTVLRQFGLRVRPGDGLLHVDNPPPADQVTKKLAENGLYLSHLSLQRPSLEDTFFELTDSAALGHAGADVPQDGDAPGAPVPQVGYGHQARQDTVPRRDGLVPGPDEATLRRHGMIPAPGGPRPEGAIPRPEGLIPRPEGAIPRPEGAIPRPEGAIPRPEGAIPRPEGAIPRPEGAIPRPNDTILRSGGAAPAPNGAVSRRDDLLPRPATAPRQDDLAPRRDDPNPRRDDPNPSRSDLPPRQ